MKIDITLKQFEILEDVLSEIEEYRVYESEDGTTLKELQEIFSYSEYKRHTDEENSNVIKSTRN